MAEKRLTKFEKELLSDHRRQVALARRGIRIGDKVRHQGARSIATPGYDDGIVIGLHGKRATVVWRREKKTREESLADLALMAPLG